MKKTTRVLALFLCMVMLFGFCAFADTSYEEKIIEMYRLSDRAVEFMREHNVDFSIFEGAEIQPEGYPFTYSSQIESFIAEAQAYGFSDEQVSAYIRGCINTTPIIVGGPWDNTGRKKVIVPDYPFVINGTEIDFKDSEYPVISYKDITYFPMTWHYCRMLGVTTDWSHEEGFRVEKASATAEPIEYGKSNNTGELYAVLPEYDIFVNGKKIENGNEQYPLLNFRNVTYFPLTWDFIINEFGWSYTFDSENGLVINSAEDKKENLNDFRIIGYYSGDLFEEPLENLQTDKLTHIMYAFLIPQADGSVLPLAEDENVRQLIEKAHNDNCEVFIAVGGWSYNNVPLQSAFEQACSTSETRDKLVNSIVSIVEDYGFDGVELDWEYPNSASAENYEALILELDKELESRGKQLTAALNGAWSQTEGPEVSNYVSDACLNAFDFINVMSYDMNNEQHSPFWFANTSIDYWIYRGVKPEKIVLGMPLYARPTYMQYRHLAEKNKSFVYNDYAVIDGVTSYYNGLPTLCKKTILAAYKAGGVMLFDVNEDTNDETSIVSMIDETLSHIESNGFVDISSLEFLEKANNTDELIGIIK